MMQLDGAVPRLLPSAELPKYTYVPGSGSPHPIRDPRGHSHNRKQPPPLALDPESWAENRCYLWAIDLFNLGFYWEAHEEWERLLRATGADSTCGRFLKGLIKLAAAGVKVREHSLAKIPVMLVVGKREAEEKTVSIRRLGSQAQEAMPLAEAIRLIAAEAVPPDFASKPQARQNAA